MKHNSHANIVPVRGVPKTAPKSADTPLAIIVALFSFFWLKNFATYAPIPPPIFIGASILPTEAPARCDSVVIMNMLGTVLSFISVFCVIALFTISIPSLSVFHFLLRYTISIPINGISNIIYGSVFLIPVNMSNVFMNSAPSTPPRTPTKDDIITKIRYGSSFSINLSSFSSFICILLFILI